MNNFKINDVVAYNDSLYLVKSKPNKVKDLNYMILIANKEHEIYVDVNLLTKASISYF